MSALPAAPTARRLPTGWEALTTDGHVVRIRLARGQDAGALREFASRVSDRSLYLRFFAANRAAATRYLVSLARRGTPDHTALLAMLGGTVVGVAGWERLTPERAEVALLVDDDHQLLGIGTLLLEELTARARAHGVSELVADTLAENHRMLHVLHASGLRGRTDQAYGVVRSRLRTDVDDDALALMDRREAEAEAASLAPLFAPHAVAVIGAGRRPGGVGHEVLRSILAGGFAGHVYAVNPNAVEVAGLRSYRQVGDVPDKVDLAVVAVPPAALVGVVEECGQAGARAAVVLTSGLGEVGSDGARLQADLLATARRCDVRLVGPNCLGLVNTDPAVRLDAWFGPTALTPGPVAVGTQSGAIGIAMADYAARSGLGVASLVSLGNKADVSGNDLLLRWWGDPRVGVIALYLESLGNPRKFARLAREVGHDKPVLVVKGGRSTGGQRAGLSHTAAAATSDAAVDALFAQAGVIRLDTVEELVDVARVAAAQPPPAGGRLAIVGNGGGAGVVAADAAQAAGLDVPQLSAPLVEALGADRDNPVDLGAGAGPAELRRAVEIVAGSGEVDALLVSVTATRANDAAALVAAVARARIGTVTVLVNLLGGADAMIEVPLARGDRAPVFPFPESAVRALGHVVRHARWRRTPRGCRPAFTDLDRPAARRIVDRCRAARSAAGAWLDARTTHALLACYGISGVATRHVRSAAGAVRAADRLGYPVVLKTDVAAIVHKTDVAAVRTGLADAEAVRTAYVEMTGRLAGGALVQPMVAATAELLIGVTRHAAFGPVAVVGLGGVYADLLGDRSLGLLPLRDREAATMLASLRAAPLLQGYRGAAPADVPAVEELMLRVSELAIDVPEIAELDLNPVMVSPGGVVVVDAKLRLAAPPDIPDATSRHLRG